MTRLEKIIRKNNIEANAELAARLFPKRKHPYRAMMRLLGGDGELTLKQLEAVADMLGKPVSEILD
jgi:hypothetical protein